MSAIAGHQIIQRFRSDIWIIAGSTIPTGPVAMRAMYNYLFSKFGLIRCRRGLPRQHFVTGGSRETCT